MHQTGATFADAAAEWLRYVEHDRKRRPSTVRDYRNTITARLEPEFGDEPLEAIDIDRIDRWRAGLLAEGKLTARTINKYIVILHGIFKRAMRVHGLRTNPVARVDRQPQRRSGDFQVLTPGEARLLVANAESEQDAAIFTVAAFTGLRLGEVRALRWRDIDFTKRIVHVRRNRPAGGVEADPKSGKVRSVPLIDQAGRMLDGLSRREHFTESDDLVFVSVTGGPVDDSQLRRRYYDALERAELPRLRFHDLRHTFGTLAVQAFPLSDVKAMMGHADISTTMIYVHHVPQHDAADRLGQLVEAAENPLEQSVSRNVSRTEQN